MGQRLIVMSCNPMGETMMVACMARSLPRVERVLYPGSAQHNRQEWLKYPDHTMPMHRLR
mgnify:CR=1 FL=1